MIVIMPARSAARSVWTAVTGKRSPTRGTRLVPRTTAARLIPRASAARFRAKMARIRSIVVILSCWAMASISCKHSLQLSGLARLPNKKGAMPATYSRRRRGPKPERRRALELLAASPDGCSEAIMLAHGFTVDFLVDLIRTGMATTRTERVVAGGRAMEVARVRITEVGAAGTRGASMALILGRTSGSRPFG